MSLKINGTTGIETNTDTGEIKVGENDDLRIYHSGSHSYIQDQGDGNLYVLSNQFEVLNAAGNEAQLRCTQDGGTLLFHNNAAKLETTATGATVTGTLAATAVTGDGSGLTGIAGGVVNSTVGSDNVVAGTNAGQDLAAGSERNTFVGSHAGKEITTGDDNIAIGSSALIKSVDGCRNVAIGSYAGHENLGGCANVNIGYGAGYGINTGNYNICIGREAGYAITSGEHNIFLGREAGEAQTTESSCIGIGKYVAKTMDGSSNLVAMGTTAGYELTDGHDNTFIGAKSGYSVTSGDANVCIGYEAGRDQISSHNNSLFIARDNVNAGNAGCWIHGDGSGNVYQGNNSSSWTTTSDQYLKKDITDNNVGLSVVDQIKVRNFKYKQYNRTEEVLYTKSDTIPEGKEVGDIKTPRTYTPVTSDDEIDLSKFPNVTDVNQVLLGQGKTATQIGVIAQELEAICPDCVSTNPITGVKKVDTDEVFWHMLNAIKELSTKVKALEAA